MSHSTFLDSIFKVISLSEIVGLKDSFTASEDKSNYPLMGRDSILDSMDLVSLVLSIEQEIQLTYPKLSLVSDSAMSRKLSPFRSPSAMASFLEEQILS